MGTLLSLYNAMRTRATAFYEILPAGETCLYADIDLKVDAPFDDNDRKPPDTLVALITQSGFGRQDLDATCVEFTERESRLGGRWLRLAFEKAIPKLMKVRAGKKLDIRWTDASRPGKFSHHMLVPDIMCENAPVACRSLTHDASALVFLYALAAINKDREERPSAGAVRFQVEDVDDDLNNYTAELRFKLRWIGLHR